MKKTLLPFATALLLAAGAASAAEVDAASAAILEKAIGTAQKAPGFSVTLDIQSVIGVRPVAEPISFELAVAQPNKYSRRWSMGGFVQEMRISDGTNVSTYLADLKAYDVTPAAPTMDALIDSDRFASLTIVSTFGTSDAYNRFVSMTESISHAGVEELDGVKMDKMKVKLEDGDAVLYVTQGETPTLHSLVIGGPQGSNTTYAFSNWNFAPAPELFTFVVPEGEIRKVDSIPAEIERMQTEMEADGPKGLIGKKAPDFTLKADDGTDVKLSSLEGKQIVLLDFWATWCGPCRDALPEVQSVAAEFKDQNVVAYAVNLQEDADTVTRFATMTGLTLPVLFDTEGETAMQYRAASIPQTVLIDKNGIVQAVHQGFAKGETGKELRAELTALVAGKSLAPAAPEAAPAPAAAP